MAAAAFALASPVAAQILPFDQVGDYSIVEVRDAKICFGVIEARSKAGALMVYSYYRTPGVQRWHVAGYLGDNPLTSDTVSIRLTVDGVETLSRETATKDGDFILPFLALPEIEAHEALVETGDTLVIEVNGTDSLTLPLADFRAADAAIQSCLTTQ